MSDEVKGIAVLDDRNPEHVLYCVCVPDKSIHLELNDSFVMRLPARTGGTARSAEPQWEYVVSGALLQMSPSVRVHTTLPIPDSKENREVEIFHNSGSWQIPFVRYSEAGAGDEGRWSMCRRLNGALFS